jgi:nitrite reductase/ring-hydroxylating ferredoxin subunit/uncharacterized membrane protein
MMSEQEMPGAAGPTDPVAARLPSALPARLDAVTGMAERSRVLASIGQSVGGFVDRVVRPGPVKDLLAGTWLRHPLHPMLTDVPIGAWTAAEALDLMGGRRYGAAVNGLVGFGVVTSIPTAVTGLSELSDVVTDRDRALGSLHALTNICASALFAASYVARRRERIPFGRALSLAGFVTVLGGGFLGGHLSYRRGIGVDQTTFEPTLDDWTDALAVADLRDGKPTNVRVGTTDVLVFRDGAAIHALANRCTHRGGPLDEGEIVDGAVRCPWHQSAFELATGEVVQGPASAPQPSYQVRTRDGRIELRSRA